MRWDSLSLRLNAAFVVVLVAAALIVGYLFDRGRAEALKQYELEKLRLHATRGADEVARLVGQLQRDVSFLSTTPPISGMARALKGGGIDAEGESTLDQWRERLQQIFLSFAETRPEYFQIRLIGARDGGRELVRVDRTTAGVRAIPPEALQRKGERYYVQEALALQPGTSYLSRIDLNRDHGELSVPDRPTLRAAAPVFDSGANPFALVVLNMDMAWVFNRAGDFRDGTETLFIADEQGEFLFHPEPGRAFSFERSASYRLEDAYPEHAAAILGVGSGEGAFVNFSGPLGGHVAFVTARSLGHNESNRRFVMILDEPMDTILHNTGLLHRPSLIGMGALLLLAIALVFAVVRRLTRSLCTLARASTAIAEGEYRIALPIVADGEVGSLVRAFRHMAAEVERRENSLAELNRELERRVEERTLELARQHSVQQLILENIADGVVVTDRDGRFLLWNRNARQIIGAGPEDVPPEFWATRYGVYHEEGGDVLTTDELPLVRAIHGEATDNLELYLSNPEGESGRWAQVTARPLYNEEGQIAGGVAVLIDVTEKKRWRNRLKSHRIELARVGRLALGAAVASSTTHQLSQPIAAIANYAGAAARLQQQGRLGESDLLDLLTRIELLSTQAGEVLNRLRALIRRSPTSAPIDLNEVADSCLDFFADRIDRQGVEVERSYGDELPMPIGDPMELGQVLIQLIANALEAMEGPSPHKRHLTIRTGYNSDEGATSIEVADCGRGVSPAAAQYLFEPWRTEKAGALGIGLYIAQSIMESRGGRIEMEGRECGGALFRVWLPVKRESTE